jgi:hypothetical protein
MSHTEIDGGWIQASALLVGRLIGGPIQVFVFDPAVGFSTEIRGADHSGHRVISNV